MTVGLLSFANLLTAPNGKSLLNGFHSNDIPFKNLVLSTSGALIPGQVDANGYPTQAPSGNTTGVSITFSPNYTGRYRVTWTGVGAIQLTGQTAKIYDGGTLVPGVTPSNTGTVANNFTISGDMSLTPHGYVEFDLNGAISGNPQNINFPSGGTYTGFTNLILCRSSAPYTNDLIDAQSGVLSRMFNADFISTYSTLNPLVLRLMDVSGANGTNIANSANMTPLSAINFGGNKYPPNLWCSGGTSGTDQFTCAAAPNTPGSWTDGEQFQVTFNSAPTKLTVLGAAAGASNGIGGNYIRLQLADTSTLSNGQIVNCGGYNGGSISPSPTFGAGIFTINVIDSTHIDLVNYGIGTATLIPSTFSQVWSSGGSVSTATINVGGRGAKILANLYGYAPSLFQTISSGTTVTCIYDALLNCVLVQPAGLTGAWPLAVRVALCNKLNMHYWHNYPIYYDLLSVASDAAYIAANLNSNLNCYQELANELWQTGNPQSQYCITRSQALNISGGAGYAGLRHRQVMGQVATTWGARGNLQRVLPWQGTNFPSGTINVLLLGTDLVASNASYLAFVGGVDPGYNSAPNRPVDFCEHLSFAPYYSGLLDPSGINANGHTVTALDLSLMTGAADAWPTNPAAAFAWLDNDIRQGTVQTKAITSVTSNVFTLASHGYSNGQQMMLSTAGTLYAGFSATTPYYIVNATANTTFQLSASSGGSPMAVSGGSGTINIGILINSTVLAWLTDWYPAFTAAATTYGKGLICYEGAFQGSIPTQANCTTFSISSTYGNSAGSATNFSLSGGSYYNMWLAYKHDATFQATVTKQFNDLVGAFPGAVPGWYTSSGNGTGQTPSYPWAIVPTDIYGTPYFKSYDAIEAFN